MPEFPCDGEEVPDWSFFFDVLESWARSLSVTLWRKPFIVMEAGRSCAASCVGWSREVEGGAAVPESVPGQRTRSATLASPKASWISRQSDGRREMMSDARSGRADGHGVRQTSRRWVLSLRGLSGGCQCLAMRCGRRQQRGREDADVEPSDVDGQVPAGELRAEDCWMRAARGRACEGTRWKACAGSVTSRR